MGKPRIIQQLIGHFQRENIQNVVVLTDKNVNRCYPDYFSELSDIASLDKIVVRPGEKTKSIRTVSQIWDFLAEKQYDKNVFLLNFGGGMVCDLGGFVASTYKRGIRFANCPTTLLAMIDAAVGGKTAVNLHYAKNQIGTFYFPDIPLSADISLLKTLPRKEMVSGCGELVKYALVGSADLFKELSQTEPFPEIKQEHIDFCIHFKQEVVRKDPKDRHVRHILNFGHTVGHAIESYSAQKGEPVAHGLAVAQGLYYECMLSTKLGHLPQQEWQQISGFLKKRFDIMPITAENMPVLLAYMQKDKKNHDGLINFTLLNHIGDAVPDFKIAPDTIPPFILNP